MRRLSLHELITSNILSETQEEIEWDLRHIYRAREGSAEKRCDELLAELLAEAIILIREKIPLATEKSKFGEPDKLPEAMWNVTPITRVKFLNECKKAMDKLCEEFNIGIENLTREQVANVILQAIACGDIQKLVRITDGGQNVIYMPYAREQELEFRIQDLENEKEQRIKFTQEWFSNPNRSIPKTEEEYSKLMDGWNEMAQKVIKLEQIIQSSRL